MSSDEHSSYDLLPKLYFDINAWMRPFQVKNNTTRLESDAILEIMRNHQSIAIHSSEFETNFFERTQYSHSLSDVKKSAFAKAYTICKKVVIDLDKNDPNCFNEIKEFHDKVCLHDREDRFHIVIAWMKKIDYFITADRELFLDRKNDIQSTLASMYHILADSNSHKMEILNPREFVSRFIKNP